MNALRIALSAVVACLLLVYLFDRSRETEQLHRVDEAMRAVADVEQKQLSELQQLHRDLDARPLTAVPAGSASGSTGMPAAAGTASEAPPYQLPSIPTGVRDGDPKLGVNFLMPYDRSAFHPAWIHGTFHKFDDTPRRTNPILDNSATVHDMYDLVTDSLCFRPPYAPERWSEQLADSVIITNDFKTYTFHIRSGIFWQRPTFVIHQDPAKYAWLDKDVELTADDFKFYIDIIKNPAVDCPDLRNYFDDVERVEAPDRNTLRIVWKKKLYTSLATSLSLSPLPRYIYLFNEDGTPIPPAQVGVAFNQHWFDRLHGFAGVGEYNVTAYEPDHRIRFERNPSYWGVSRDFDAIEWNFEIRKPGPRLVAFKNGQATVSGLTPLQYKDEIIDHHESRFAAADPSNPTAGRSGELGWEKVKSPVFYYVGWNMRRPPFDDIRVRQAMSYDFPKERLIREVYYGLGTPALSDVMPDSQYCNHQLNPYAFDPEKAKALLEEAGWKDEDGSGIRSKVIDGKPQKLSFTMKYGANNPTSDNVLAIYRNELKRIGVDMKITPLEWKELMRVFEDKDFEAVEGAWEMDVDVDFYQLWHSSQADPQGSSNICGVKDSALDALIVQLRETFDTKERIDIAKRIQTRLNELQAYTYFLYPEGILVWQNKGPPRPNFYLDGITEYFDKINPLVLRRCYYWWHFRPE